MLEVDGLPAYSTDKAEVNAYSISLSTEMGTNQMRRVAVVTVCLIIIISGCAMTQSSENMSQENESEIVQHPEITLSGEILSIDTNNEAVEKQLDAAQPVYVHLATVQIHNLTVKNPNDAWLPSELKEGSNITVVFERSTEPAQIVYLPEKENQQENTTNDSNQQSSGEAGTVGEHELRPPADVKSVEQTDGRWLFTVSDPAVVDRETVTLPGITPGDFIRADLIYGQPLSVTTYESVPDDQAGSEPETT